MCRLQFLNVVFQDRICTLHEIMSLKVSPMFKHYIMRARRWVWIQGYRSQYWMKVIGLLQTSLASQNSKETAPTTHWTREWLGILSCSGWRKVPVSLCDKPKLSSMRQLTSFFVHHKYDSSVLVQLVFYMSSHVEDAWSKVQGSWGQEMSPAHLIFCTGNRILL